MKTLALYLTTACLVLACSSPPLGKGESHQGEASSHANGTAYAHGSGSGGGHGGGGHGGGGHHDGGHEWEGDREGHYYNGGRRSWYGGGNFFTDRTWYGSRDGYIQLYDGSYWIIAPEDFDRVYGWGWPNEQVWIEETPEDTAWPYRMHYGNETVRVKSR